MNKMKSFSRKIIEEGTKPTKHSPKSPSSSPPTYKGTKPSRHPVRNPKTPKKTGTK